MRRPYFIFLCCVCGISVESRGLSETATSSTVLEPIPAATSSTLVEPTLVISGNRTTTVRYQHYSSLSPSAASIFKSGFTRHETTRLRVSGHANEKFKIDGAIFQNDVDFDNRYYLRLATDNYELFLGEFSVSLADSEFTLFNRSLQGAKLTGKVPLSDDPAPRIEFTTITSSPRGKAKYEKFYGSDTQGPYRLSRYPVVLDSEKVMVDKVPQIRNVDYEINHIAGQITFKKGIIETKSLVEVTYEARETLYPRSLNGGQVKYQFSDYDSVSVIALDERDKKDSGVYALSGKPATAHTVLGTTYRHNGEYMRGGGEFAHSFYDPDRFIRGLENGNAYKGGVEFERYGLLVGGNAKRIEPNYQTLGNTSLGNDFVGWDAYGGLGISRIAKLSGRHEQRRTMLDGLENRFLGTDAKLQVNPDKATMARYRIYESEEKYAANYDRTERRQSADASRKFKYLSVSSGYERQDISFADGAQPDKRWDAGKAGLGVSGISWLAASVNGEVRSGRETSSLYSESKAFKTMIGSANLNLTPHERYFLSGSNRWQQTTGKPAQNTLRTEAKARPIDGFSLGGSFSQETLQVYSLGENKGARKDSYAGLADVKPTKSLLFMYQPSFRETVMLGTRPAVNSNRRDNYTAKWNIDSSISTEAGLSTESYRLRDADDPVMRIKTLQDSDTWNVALRLAPIKEISSELSYRDKTSEKSQLNSYGSYDTRDTHQQIVKAGIRPQLEAELGMAASYRFERYKQTGTQGPAAVLPLYSISPLDQKITDFSLLNDYTGIYTHQHTADANVSYQWNKAIQSSAKCAYDIKIDRLGLIRDIETLSVGAGMQYRVRVFKIDGRYTLAQSRGGADTFQQSFSGSLDVIPAKQVRWSTRAEYVTRTSPASAMTDVTSSLEVSF